MPRRGSGFLRHGLGGGDGLLLGGGGAVHFPARSIRAGPSPGRVNLLGRSESALREFSAALRIRGAEAPGAVRAQLGLPPHAAAKARPDGRAFVNTRG